MIIRSGDSQSWRASLGQGGSPRWTAVLFLSDRGEGERRVGDIDVQGEAAQRTRLVRAHDDAVLHALVQLVLGARCAR